MITVRTLTILCVTVSLLAASLILNSVLQATGRTLRARGQVFDEGAEAAGILVDANRWASVEQPNRRLPAIVTFSDDAIVGEALDGNVTDWNRGAETVFGYTADEIIGKPLAILLLPDQANEADIILNRLKRGDRIEHHETQRRRKDGTIIDVSLTISPLFDASGRLVGASTVARDITEPRSGRRPPCRNGKPICAPFWIPCRMR